MSSDTPESTSFEHSLDELERIVAAMEGGEIALEELLTRYEQGVKLLQICEKRLKQAELRIETLRRQNDGSPQPDGFVSAQDGARD